jgi:hypothetical protein
MNSARAEGAYSEFSPRTKHCACSFGRVRCFIVVLAIFALGIEAEILLRSAALPRDKQKIAAESPTAA